jgi:hypothetical protein
MGKGEYFAGLKIRGKAIKAAYIERQKHELSGNAYHKQHVIKA